MNTLFFFVTFGFFTVFTAGIFQMAFERKWRMARRVSSLYGSEDVYVENGNEEKHQSFKERVVVPVWSKFRSMIVQRTTSRRKEKLEQRLAQAGSPFELSVGDFLLVEWIVVATLFCLFLLCFIPSGKPLQSIFLALIAAGMGFGYFRLYLEDRKKKRIKLIEKSMPDFFDMVNVSLEAGLGLDAAIQKVAKRMGGAISEEFLQTLEEMKLGKVRREAFSDLRERVPSELFQSVVGAMIQADQFGIGMTKVIRSQTKRIREQRRQKAREQAMKAPVKMLIPLVLFVFPTLFIVILGPIIVKLITQWL